MNQRSHRRFRRWPIGAWRRAGTLLVATLPALAGAAERPASAPSAAAAASAPAVEVLRPGWQVLHCGFARGVLYVTYAERGQAAIVAAVPNAAIADACAKAGHPLPDGTARRGPAATPPAGRPPAAAPRAAPPANRSLPTFTPLALGGSLAISARNDSDIAWRCTINYSWTADDAAAGPRSATTQATLPPRQVTHVTAVGSSGAVARNLRFNGLPSAFCTPAG